MGLKYTVLLCRYAHKQWLASMAKFVGYCTKKMGTKSILVEAHCMEYERRSKAQTIRMACRCSEVYYADFTAKLRNTPDCILNFSTFIHLQEQRRTKT